MQRWDAWNAVMDLAFVDLEVTAGPRCIRGYGPPSRLGYTPRWAAPCLIGPASPNDLREKVTTAANPAEGSGSHRTRG